jgi:hypothetical protein
MRYSASYLSRSPPHTPISVPVQPLPTAMPISGAPEPGLTDGAHPCHIGTGTGLSPCHIGTGTGLTSV